MDPQTEIAHPAKSNGRCPHCGWLLFEDIFPHRCSTAFNAKPLVVFHNATQPIGNQTPFSKEVKVDDRYN